MAVRQKKRKRCWDGDGSKVWSRLQSSLSYMGIVVFVVVAVADWAGCGLMVTAVPITTVTMVVSKNRIPNDGPCVDSFGNKVGDQANWTDGCSRVVCHVEPSGNYTVTHQCPDQVPSQNPDSVNCYNVANTSATFPDCCPYLECGTASILTTLNPSLCFDKSPIQSCLTWKELSDNCTLITSLAYNFTVTFCQATCGHCMGGAG